MNNCASKCKSTFYPSVNKFEIEWEREIHQSLGWSAETDMCSKCKEKNHLLAP